MKMGVKLWTQASSRFICALYAL